MHEILEAIKKNKADYLKGLMGSRSYPEYERHVYPYVSPEKWTLLELAIRHGAKKVVELFINSIPEEKKEEIINHPNKKTDNSKKVGTSPFQLAIMLNHSKIAKLLIENGADVNQVSNDGSGNTPLHIVTDPEVAKKLIEYGAGVNTKNAHGNTPMNNAITKECGDIIQILNNPPERITASVGRRNSQDSTVSSQISSPSLSPATPPSRPSRSSQQ